jgi:AbiV family abortive infection protein
MPTYSLDHCKKGVRNAVSNANRLHSDAAANLQESRYLAAALLACYAIDEIGKAFLLAKVTLAAMKDGKQELSRSELRSEGVLFDHHVRLEMAARILFPLLTGAPPGIAFTDNLQAEWKDTIWKLRNAVAYVEADDGVFVEPTQIDRATCESAVDLLSRIRAIVEKDVVPYLDNAFSGRKP